MSKRIFTMQDIMDTVTEENIDRFIPDLIQYITMVVASKGILDKSAQTEGFDWIDDGLNNSEIDIRYANGTVNINKDKITINTEVKG